MGVTNLWPELSQTCEEGISVTELSGKTVAVDLSAWILEFRKLEATQSFSNLYFRNLFYRILCLLKCGIKLVFVCDGQAPEVKRAVMLQRQGRYFGNKGSENLERSWFKSYNDKCKQVIEKFGLPCVQSDGEAEAVCAELNRNGLVDGVITNDSDVLLYGANTVYRNLKKQDDEYSVDVYSMDSIEEELGLNQRSLIAMGLLVGCDYDKKGVESIGPKKALELMRHLKQLEHDPLDRICGWRENEDLSNYQEILESPERKEPHCKCCNHLGTRQIHDESGCARCEMERSCEPSNEKPCQCEHHKMKIFELELRIRSKALKDESFPNQKIIHEFLTGGRITTNQILYHWKSIDIGSLQNVMCEHLRTLNGAKFYEEMAQLLACLHLHEAVWCLNEELTLKPIRIVKHCKRKRKLCLETEWTKLASDKVTQSEFYSVIIEKELFCKRYPEMVEEFRRKCQEYYGQKAAAKEKYRKEKAEKKKTEKGKKRKAETGKEATIKSFFSVKKKAKTGKADSESSDEGISSKESSQKSQVSGSSSTSD